MLQNRRFVVANYERVFPKQYHMTVDTFLHQALQLQSIFAIFPELNPYAFWRCFLLIYLSERADLVGIQ